MPVEDASLREASAPTRAPPELREMAAALVKSHPECFWFRHPEARIRHSWARRVAAAPIQVFDEEGTLIGDYLADLLVAGEVVVELKVYKALAPEHEAQILGNLRSARLRHELLINFGSCKFEIGKFVGMRVKPREQR